jgi:hypothetical protein
MRRTLGLALLAAALIAVTAADASATAITVRPSGSISATINRLGFSGFLIQLFTCDVTMSGSVSAGPITLPGRAGSVSSVSITNCSSPHNISTSGLPWSLNAETTLRRCPSSSTGVLGTLPATFIVDGITTRGNVGTLVSSGTGTISILRSSLSNSGMILPGSGTYSPVQTISC